MCIISNKRSFLFTRPAALPKADNRIEKTFLQITERRIKSSHIKLCCWLSRRKWTISSAEIYATKDVCKQAQSFKISGKLSTICISNIFLNLSSAPIVTSIKSDLHTRVFYISRCFKVLIYTEQPFKTYTAFLLSGTLQVHLNFKLQTSKPHEMPFNGHSFLHTYYFVHLPTYLVSSLGLV